MPQPIQPSPAVGGLQAAMSPDQMAQSLMGRNSQVAQMTGAAPQVPQAPTPDQMPQGGGMIQQALRALGLSAPPPAPRTSDINLEPDPSNQLPLDELLKRAQAIQ